MNLLNSLSMNTPEFEIDKTTGKVYVYIYTKVLTKQESNVDTKDLINCQCKACPCSKLVLKTDLVCDRCWEHHMQYEFFKRITVPKEDV